MTAEVPPLDGPAQAVAPDQLRASHQERDQAAELLRVAAGDGRITAEELDERLEVALTARTYGELAALLTDLPGAPGRVAGAAAPEPKDVERIHCVSSVAGRTGRWVVPLRIEVQVRSGSVTLDFTEAVITRPLLTIDAQVRSGTLTLVTKPGVVVETGDVAVKSSVVKVRAPWDAGGPVLLRIEVSGSVRGGVITARPPSSPSSPRPPRPPRRTFWSWLRRRPRPHALAPADRPALPGGGPFQG